MRGRLLAACLSLLVCTAVGAQDAVLQVILSREPDQRLSEIVYLSVGVEVTGAGFDSRRLGASPIDPRGFDRDAALRNALRDGVPLMLTVDFTVEGSTVILQFALLDTRSAKLLSAAELRSPLDFDLDARIARAARELIASAGLGQRASATARIEGVGPGPVEPTVESVVIEPRRAVGPEFGVLTGGFLVLGSASDFFRFGLSGSLSGGYLPAAWRGVGVGARASALRMFGVEGLVGGDLYVFAGGPDIQLGTAYRAPARLSLRVSGGPAVLMVVRDDRTMAKTVPYVDGAVVARLPFGSWLALGLELAALVAFEPGAPIFTVSPSLVVSVEP